MRGGANSISIWLVPLGLLALAAALFAFDASGLATQLSGFEYSLYQQQNPRTYEDPFARSHLHVRVLNFDDAALRKFGAWPWASDRLAELTAALKKDGALVVVFAFPLDLGDPASPQRFAAQLPANPEYDAARATLNKMVSSDEAFAEAMSGTKAVTGFTLTNVTGDDNVPLKPAIASDGASNPYVHVAEFDRAVRALPLIETASAALGAMNLTPDRDGVLRNVALVDRLNGKPVASLDTAALAVALAPPQIHAMDGSIPGIDASPSIARISFGGFFLPTRRDGAITPWY